MRYGEACCSGQMGERDGFLVVLLDIEPRSGYAGRGVVRGVSLSFALPGYLPTPKDDRKARALVNRQALTEGAPGPSLYSGPASPLSRQT